MEHRLVFQPWWAALRADDHTRFHQFINSSSQWGHLFHISMRAISVQPLHIVVLGQNWANFQFFSLSSIYLWAENLLNHKILWFSVVLSLFLRVESCSATPSIYLWASYRLDHKMLWFWLIFACFPTQLIKIEALLSPSGLFHRYCGWVSSHIQYLWKKPRFLPLWWTGISAQYG